MLQQLIGLVDDALNWLLVSFVFHQIHLVEGTLGHDLRRIILLLQVEDTTVLPIDEAAHTDAFDIYRKHAVPLRRLALSGEDSRVAHLLNRQCILRLRHRQWGSTEVTQENCRVAGFGL